MLRVKKVYVDYSEYDVIDNDHPMFSWSAVSELNNSEQAGYEIEVNKKNGGKIWNAAALNREQKAQYAGPPFEEGEIYGVRVRIKDNHGNLSAWSEPKEFTAGRMDWQAGWIAVKEDKVRVPAQFYTSFENNGDIAGCVLFVCGVGYHRVSVNGRPLKRGELAPSYTNFAKLCCYEVLDAARLLKEGVNTVAVTVADGWRRMDSQFIFDHIRREIEFFGTPQLSASIKLTLTDGSVKWLHTGSYEWKARRTPIIEANLYDGMVYDERLEGREEELTVEDAPCLGIMRADAAEPITMHETYKPVSIFWPKPGVAVVDFGQNIAGVCRLRLPKKMQCGQSVIIEHAEMLDEDGTLYMAPLRGVKARDEFISSGREYDNEYFMPAFTYHGFRYAQIHGYEDFCEEDIEAVALYSDMASGSFFECGNPMLNRIHKNCVQTEKSNIYSIFTDCPQRNERMAWINDLTPRFEALPYNFNISRLFTKTVRDIINDQQDGMIAYTNPYIYSARPADPICSSFLIAGQQSLLFAGNEELVREGYEHFKAWEDYLLGRSEDYILNFTLNGDWASPDYACIDAERCYSAVTPGELLSTGYSYYNCLLLSRFARSLGKSEESDKYAQTALKVREAFLNKWFDAQTGKVGTGSDACQAFALWLDILPEEGRAKAAEFMRNQLKANNYRFTAGSICLRYMVEMLTRYGYVDDAYTLMTLDKYPSYGYSIQNEGTTIWERFELKKNPTMNSHSHPMYASVDKWLYGYICGVSVLAPGCSEIKIQPYFPTGLLSAQCRINTIKGDIGVRWVRKYGAFHIYLNIPFGVKAQLYLPVNYSEDAANVEYASAQEIGSGCYCFTVGDGERIK